MILGWLVRVALVLTVGAIMLFDVVSLAYTNTAVQEDARAVARTASHAVLAQDSDQLIILQAEQTASERGVELVLSDMTLTKDGAVTVTVRRTAPSILLHRIPALREHLTSTATFRSDPISL